MDHDTARRDHEGWLLERVESSRAPTVDIGGYPTGVRSGNRSARIMGAAVPFAEERDVFRSSRGIARTVMATMTDWTLNVLLRDGRPPRTSEDDPHLVSGTVALRGLAADLSAPRGTSRPSRAHPTDGCGWQQFARFLR